jgi:4a-hydroxytetrahydrobiopterin dehydratase
MDLKDKKCVPCEGGTPPIEGEALTDYVCQIKPTWQVIDQKKLSREFKFKNFVEAMAFVNKVAAIAEAEQHHPDVQIHYNKVTIELWTHAIGGLSENDFILASKLDALS